MNLLRMKLRPRTTKMAIRNYFGMAIIYVKLDSLRLNGSCAKAARCPESQKAIRNIYIEGQGNDRHIFSHNGDAMSLKKWGMP